MTSKKVERKDRTPVNLPKDNSMDDSSINFLVVGIGASAGGYEACKQLLAILPADSGMAFVIVRIFTRNIKAHYLSHLTVRAVCL